MGRARRQLPLYEVLSSSPRRTGVGRPVPVRHDAVGAAQAAPVEAQPVEVTVDEAPPVPAAPSAPEPEIKPVAREPFRRTHAPVSAPAPSSAPPADGESTDGALRLPASTLLILLAVLIAVVAVAWTIAFRMGVQAEAAKKGEQFPDAPSPDQLVSGPASGQPSGSPSPNAGDGGAARPATPAPQPKPTPPTPAATGSDPRIPGYNYLYLGTLTERDATAGVTFLTQNGVPAFYVVDRSKGGANNPPCRIYAAEGVPSDRYRDSQRERDELVRKVEEVGRRWQRDHKGASDFRQPYWTLHKG